MKKRLILISALVLALVLALFAFTACNNASTEIGEELIKNGDFSQYTELSDNKIHFDDWSLSSSSVTYYKGTRSDTGENEDFYMYIVNSSRTYSYLKQTIAVDRNCYYKVSFDLRLNDSLSGSNYGAYISFLENTENKFQYQTEKTDGFQTYTFYVRPKNTDYLTVALCLGTEEEGCSGTARFDNVSVTRVEKSSIPDGKKVYDFRKARTVVSTSTVSGICFVVLLTLATVAIIIAVYVIVRRIYARRDAFADFGCVADTYVSPKRQIVSAKKWYQNCLLIAAALAIGAFLIRLILLLTTFGMGGDMANIVTASKWLGSHGVMGFFENYTAQSSLGASTMSAGSLYILTILGAMGANLDVNSMSILIRFINVLADMAVVLMIYFYGRKYVGNKLSTVYAALYAALPFVFTMSGINGTFDALLVALLLAAIILMVEKKYLPTYLLMTLASVLDVRALALAPIVVAYFVYRYIKDNGDIRKFTANRAMIVFGLVGSFVLAYLLTLPVGIHQIAAGDAFYNFKTIVNQITKTTYFVKNAFNLYGMVAMNGKAIAQVGVNILNLIFLLVLEAYVISLYFKNRNKQELILLASFALAVIAVFTLKVDYTYLFLSLAFAIIYTMISGDRRMYGIIGGYSALGFLDIAQLLSQSNLIPGASTTAVLNYETTNAFYITFCVFTVLLTGYYVYVTYSITNNSKIVDIRAMNEPFVATVKKSVKSLLAKLKSKKVASND
ncbi:MAG: hypothetical protein NC037_02380 [Bacteroides sp.]|nr:hypothetical protein [Bacillota bacterium]MCM1393711.1 hypothetical protein [[Eubacterium] siraeum]MCM1455362.1 hypothetical protein [Bacteroides sp.]